MAHYSLNFPRFLDDEPIRAPQMVQRPARPSAANGLPDKSVLSELAQRGAKMAGCYASLPTKDRGQMALVGEANLLRDPGKRPIGPAH